jgi:hypothetical protein
MTTQVMGVFSLKKVCTYAYGIHVYTVCHMEYNILDSSEAYIYDLCKL